MHDLLEDAHKILSYLLAALIVIHLIGALRHQVIKKNDVVRRMLWGGKSKVEPIGERHPAE